MRQNGGIGQWNVLLIDDERQALEIYGALLREDGHPVLLARDGREARAAVESEERLGLVILDLRLPDTDGLDLFRWIRQKVPSVPVVIFTAYGSVETAVQALKEGAYHYLTKPPEVEQWRSLIRMAVQRRALEEETSNLRQQLRSANGEGDLIGRSRPMLDVYQWVRVVAPSRANILIQGESGTGKELAARAIHRRSSCSDGPFVSINCGALPPNLLESELFGHERGSFTGATASKPGQFELAEGGTIFLDEVGECSPELQVRLLRVIQEKEFQRVGGTSPKRAEFRMIAATNCSLEEEVAAGRFREDLYYRINVITITMPPLRERKEDIPLLSAFFLEKFSQREGKGISGMTDESLELLYGYDWPGNVRELQNVIERGVVVCRGEHLEAADQPPYLHDAAIGGPQTRELLDRDWRLSEVEKTVVAATVRRHGGNKSQAAKVLGISRKLLYSKIRQYGL